jgi:hypothetical protein
MVTYYFYQLTNSLKFDKCGATIDWKGRLKDNLKQHGPQSIIRELETMEGPDTPEMWQVVGDREWEIAEEYGYPKGEHYRSAREKRLKATRASIAVGVRPSKECQRLGGLAAAAKGHLLKYASEAGSKGGKKAIHGPNSVNKQKVKCPHCDKVTTPAGLGTHLKFKH